MKPPLFHVGQAVVCVNDAAWGDFERWKEIGARFPIRGPVYHVRRIDQDPASQDYGIMLKEVVNPEYFTDKGFDEPCFLETRFAPAELASDEALAELLEEVFTPVTA